MQRSDGDREEGGDQPVTPVSGAKTRTHQIRNALNAAKLQLTLLDHELHGEELSADAKHAMASIRAQIDLIADLVGDSGEPGSTGRAGARE